MSTAELLDDLTEQVQRLPAARRRILIDSVHQAAGMAEEKPKDVEGQLGLFGFRELVENDDDLKAVSVTEISKTYGISERSVLRYIQAGDLRASQFGRRYMVTIAELKRFLKAGRLRVTKAQELKKSTAETPNTKKKGGTDANT